MAAVGIGGVIWAFRALPQTKHYTYFALGDSGIRYRDTPGSKISFILGIEIEMRGLFLESAPSELRSRDIDYGLSRHPLARCNSTMWIKLCVPFRPNWHVIRGLIRVESGRARSGTPLKANVRLAELHKG